MRRQGIRLSRARRRVALRALIADMRAVRHLLGTRPARWALPLLVGISVSGCTSSPLSGPRTTPAPPVSGGVLEPSSLNHYQDGRISFNYPADWNRGVDQSFGSPSYGVLTFLSLQRLGPDCQPISRGVFQCAPALAIGGQLAGGSVFVSWVAQFVGPGGVAGVAGKGGSVAGHPARLDDNVSTNGCRPLGADHGLTAYVLRDDPTTAYVMTSCWRGPADAATGQQIEALLQSTQIVG